MSYLPRVHMFCSEKKERKGNTIKRPPLRKHKKAFLDLKRKGRTDPALSHGGRRKKTKIA